jgi:hypothetical protein
MRNNDYENDIPKWADHFVTACVIFVVAFTAIAKTA